MALPISEGDLCDVLSSGSVCDEGILQTMRRCWEENHYLLCPHTAVAVWKHYQSPVRDGEIRCCLATASPAKFAEAVHRAGLPLELPESLQVLPSLPTRFKNLERSDDWEEKLRQCIKSISEKRVTALTERQTLPHPCKN
ncbi:hypothetical protein DNTS_026220 [Danionella cerebrum]|uniref:Tryptophan synthase beta chain-like PALP domain-containing protein n=1 Tax=Danionella cerebrum TaxID=2873325 RepID=A0A553NLE9_9TELE|nr:hypothetical protein DNTS_026220 [Danionella translucida]